jgi:hypothetical protein
MVEYRWSRKTEYFKIKEIAKMKTQDFNRVYERAKTVNIVNDEWFNFAGFFWINLTNNQHNKMVALMIKQGAKVEEYRDDKWIKLRNGLLLKVNEEESK